MNHYQTLGLSPTATAAEIKAAHRKLARQHHPDMGGDPVLFKAIQEAADVLADPARRRAYDEALRNQPVESLTDVAARVVAQYFEECRQP